MRNARRYYPDPKPAPGLARPETIRQAIEATSRRIAAIDELGWSPDSRARLEEVWRLARLQEALWQATR